MLPPDEVSKAIMDVYSDLETWKGGYDDVLTSMELESAQCQFQSTAIRLWWNHAIILLFYTEDSDIMRCAATYSNVLLYELDSTFKSFFRYEEYLMGLPFRMSSFLSLLDTKCKEFLTLFMLMSVSI